MLFVCFLQNRAQVLTKQFNDLQEQIQQAHLELSTFKLLQSQEESALQRRINAIAEDVNRQIEREHSLQSRYGQLVEELEELKVENVKK